MKNNFIIQLASGVINASKLLCEYPGIDGLIEKLDKYRVATKDCFTIFGFPILGFILGVFSAFVVWAVSAILGGGIAGAILGAFLAFVLVDGKDCCGSLLFITSYISNRMKNMGHSDAVLNLTSDVNNIKGGIESSIFTMILVLKYLIYAVIVYKGYVSFLIAFFILNYSVQAFLISNRSVNSKIMFNLNMHDLDIFYVISALLLFIGLKFSIVNSFVVIFVFLIQWLLVSRLNKNDGGLNLKFISLVGGFMELLLGIILVLKIL